MKKFNPYFLLLLLNELFLLWLEATRHDLPYHDGLYYLCNQYYFLNALRQYGEIPLWSSFMSHGTTMGVNYAMASAGFLFKALFIFPWVLKFASFLFWYWATLFVDRLFLLVGVWLLSGVYFRSPKVRFFVTFTVMTSLVYYLQPGFCLYLFYCLPLVLYCLHRFFDGAGARWLAAAGLLSAVNMVGGFFYYVPVYTFTIVFYFFLCFAGGRIGRERLRLLWDKKTTWAWLLILVLLGLYMGLAWSAIDSRSTVFLADRDDKGRVPLWLFLVYGGNTDMSKWLEALVGVSPIHDYGLYFGLLSLALIAGAFFSKNKYAGVIAAVFLVLLLFSGGTAVSVLLYYAWPLMKSYRHLALISSLVKVFACFLAGFGLEVLLKDASGEEEQRRRRALGLSIMVMGLVTGFLLTVAKNPQLQAGIMNAIFAQRLSFASFPEYRPFFMEKVYFAGAMLVVLGMMLLVRDKKYRAGLIFVLLAMQVFDVGMYRMEMMGRRLIVCKQYIAPLLSFRPMTYCPRRDAAYQCSNDRDLLEIAGSRLSVTYSIFNNLTFCDTVGPDKRPSLWQKSYGRCMDAFWGERKADELAWQEYTFRLMKAMFLADTLPESFKKISAFSQDKVQFFRAAVDVDSERKAMQAIADPRFAGDALLVPTGSDSGPTHMTVLDENQLTRNDREDIPYHVVRFEPNHVDIQILAALNKPSWLFYSDAWHPRWKVSVNGQERPVYIADVAYKAVPLQPGDQWVRFRFEDPVMTSLIKIFGILSCLCLGILIFLFGQSLWEKTCDENIRS